MRSSRNIHSQYIEVGVKASAVTTNLDIEKQYLVTASHVLGNVDLKSIGVFHEDRWKQMPVNIVGIGDGDWDIAVLVRWYFLGLENMNLKWRG